MSTIKEVYLFCKREIAAGHGDFNLYQEFDCGQAAVDVNVNGAKSWFPPRGSIVLGDPYFNDTHSMFAGHESFVDWAEEQYVKDSKCSKSRSD